VIQILKQDNDLLLQYLYQCRPGQKTYILLLSSQQRKRRLPSFRIKHDIDETAPDLELKIRATQAQLLKIPPVRSGIVKLYWYQWQILKRQIIIYEAGRIAWALRPASHSKNETSSSYFDIWKKRELGVKKDDFSGLRKKSERDEQILPRIPQTERNSC
jgi:hypothetical protein